MSIPFLNATAYLEVKLFEYRARSTWFLEGFGGNSIQMYLQLHYSVSYLDNSIIGWGHLKQMECSEKALVVAFLLKSMQCIFKLKMTWCGVSTGSFFHDIGTRSLFANVCTKTPWSQCKKIVKLGRFAKSKNAFNQIL